MDLLLRPKKIIVRNIIRKDGARKKHLVDAGPADTTTPLRSLSTSSRRRSPPRAGDASRASTGIGDSRILSYISKIPGAWTFGSSASIAGSSPSAATELALQSTPIFSGAYPASSNPALQVSEIPELPSSPPVSNSPLPYSSSPLPCLSPIAEFSEDGVAFADYFPAPATPTPSSRKSSDRNEGAQDNVWVPTTPESVPAPLVTSSPFETSPESIPAPLVISSPFETSPESTPAPLVTSSPFEVDVGPLKINGPLKLADRFNIRRVRFFQAAHVKMVPRIHEKEDFEEYSEPDLVDIRRHMSPFKDYVKSIYGSKAPEVYADDLVCTLLDELETKIKDLVKSPDCTPEALCDLHREGLAKLESVADKAYDSKGDWLEKFAEFDSDDEFLEAHQDVHGPLEQRPHILERYNFSSTVAKELAAQISSDPLEDFAKELAAQIPADLLKDFPKDEPIFFPGPPPPDHVSATRPLVGPLLEGEYDHLAQVARELGAIPSAGVVKLSTTLTSHDFGTLLPQMFNGDAKGWLNDNIINEYLELLVEAVKHKENYVHVRGKGGSPPPVHAFKSQWFTSMKKDQDATARWARPANLTSEKLLGCNLVLIPICNHSHWRLIAIRPKERLIEYYDSLHGPGDEYTTLAKQWVKNVLKEHYVDEEWWISEDQKSEEQANASDCGIFTLLNALVLLRGEQHNRVQVTNGMSDARLRVAATLLAKEPTMELDA